MKKLIWLLPLGLVFLLSSFAVRAEGQLELSGKITDIGIEEKGGSVRVSVRLQMSLKAVGETPVMVWKQTNPNESSQRAFLCVYSKVLGVLAKGSGEKILHYNTCALPSIQRTSAWQDVIKRLDSATPPASEIRVIKPGESFDFNDEWAFTFLKRKAGNSNDPLWGLSSDHDVLWDEIKEARNLTLELAYRVWSSELEPRSDIAVDEKPFGKRLRNKWKESGYLWLDDIVSEPVPIDLGSVVVKTIPGG